MTKSSSALTLSILALASATACAQTIYAPTLAEYTKSSAVVQLNIKGIHSQGIIGQGVVVGVLDTGLNLNNPEFKNNSRILKGYNATNGGSDVTDTMGHGTHVTGIIAAGANGLGMYGVAPGATILPVKVFGASTASSTDIDRGLLYASSKGAKVVNLSLGASGPTGTSALSTLARTNNTLVIAAAGNEGQANPGWPARYAKESWANGTIIAVGAVDANKKIASFSNRAGDTANFYLVAPGVAINSTYGTSYALMSGTSMATPAVTGAAALIMGYWPYLKANQVATLMLNTTDDLGAKGTDAVYGRGMLNVNRALTPQGNVTYKTATGASITLALQAKGTIINQPRVASPSAFSGVSTEVYDDYGRNFTSHDGAALSSRSQMTVDSALGRNDLMLDAAERALPDGTRLMSLQTRASSVMTAGMNFGSAKLGTQGSSDPWNHGQAQALASMVSLRLASGHAVSAGDGGLSIMGLGLMGSDMSNRLSGAEAVLANPLMGFAPNHRFAALSTPLTAGWTARVGLVRSQAYDRASADVNVMELMHQGRDHALNISFGRMSEQGMLGGYSSAAMGLAQHTGSMGMTLSGALAISGPWTLAGAWSMTHTAAPRASGMLVAGTAVRADGWGLGLVKADTWMRGDRLSFTLNAPLRASTGNLTYSVVDSVNPEDGSPVYGTRTVNLKPTARELLAEARYSTHLSANSTLSAVAAYRQNPDHDASAPAQTALGVRYNLSF
jgi:hypothetical protein